ncbi:DUF5330 domain-containing protein [Aquabacter cavernae]|uniref:DUF5330 domain-containing protein n=1 Tax=Aquabacter cavernae TaxID=2496029 RepID=UPI000F8E9975|nr:DUF5330 domain-containing protein [Aquabacter cavernae]
MFFLLRLAFWLGIVLLLLPLSTSEDGTRQIGAWQALSAAQSAIADASGFCERQPQACAVGGQLLSHLGDKAQAAAEWLFANVSIGEGAHAPATADKTGGHALTPQDLVPAWGGDAADAPKATGSIPTGAAPAAPAPGSIPLPPRRPA